MRRNQAVSSLQNSFQDQNLVSFIMAFCYLEETKKYVYFFKKSYECNSEKVKGLWELMVNHVDILFKNVRKLGSS